MRVVLEKCHLLGRSPASPQHDAAGIRLRAAREIGRRHAGELTEIVDQMRLVVIAAAVGQFAPVDCAAFAQRTERALEAMDASERLRRKADLLAKESSEMLPADAGIARELGRAQLAAAFGEPSRRPIHQRMNVAAGDADVEQPLLDEREARLRIVRFEQSFAKMQRALAEEVSERAGSIRNFGAAASAAAKPRHVRRTRRRAARCRAALRYRSEAR